MAYLQERTLEIPEGHAGIEATVAVMRELARTGARSSLPRETGRAIMARSGGAGDPAGKLRAFLEAHWRFRFDPEGVEWIRTPQNAMQEIRDRGSAAGDCDDVAVLGASLALVMGMPARFVLLGFEPGAPFSHVYTEVWDGESWRDLDVTAPAQFPPGLKIHRTGYREV